MNYIFSNLLVLLRSIVLSVLALCIAYIVSFLILDLVKYIDVNWYMFILEFPIKKLVVGGIIMGIAERIYNQLLYRKQKTIGIKSLLILTNYGYCAEINEISPDIKVPFYKIDGEFFYSYTPFAQDMSFMLSGFRKIIKQAEPKNIVINLTDSSVSLDKLKRKLLDKFGNKLDKILIIDKSGSVIKLK